LALAADQLEQSGMAQAGRTLTATAGALENDGLLDAADAKLRTTRAFVNRGQIQADMLQAQGPQIRNAGVLRTGALLALAWIDLEHSLLPDAVTLPLIWAGLLVNLDGALAPLPLAVLGAVAGYLFLWVIFHFFRLLTGRDGMGHGDFKLMAALGAWLGLGALPWLLLGASLAGVLVG
ncbi:A24 family peptidase, partial [Bordetella pertussis]